MTVARSGGSMRGAGPPLRVAAGGPAPGVCGVGRAGFILVWASLRQPPENYGGGNAVGRVKVARAVPVPSTTQNVRWLEPEKENAIVTVHVASYSFASTL